MPTVPLMQDGDLDLVVNAMDDASYILRNDLGKNGNYLEVSLHGLPGDGFCTGAKVSIRVRGVNQVREISVTRGYQSSVSHVIHFGVGDAAKIDWLRIEWNKTEATLMKDVAVNQRLEIDYATAGKSAIVPAEKARPVFSPVDINGLAYTHDEQVVDDFVNEVLLPNKMSELGPFISAGDLNGDKRTDLFIGGSHGFAGALFFQEDNGSFSQSSQAVFKTEAVFEDMGSVIFDADGDGDQDIYVVSGSNEAPAGHGLYQDRLYTNDGKGNFSRSGNIPLLNESGQKVLAHDFDKDGWIDIFSFGRQVPGAYPSTPKSYVLKNSKGLFTDATDLIAPELKEAGMVTDATFTDFDTDGDDDLIVVGEWMPITIFENQSGKLVDRTVDFGLDQTIGWWSSISEYPLSSRETDHKENPGKQKKYIVGNLGTNNKFHPTPEKPLQVYMLILTRTERLILYSPNTRDRFVTRCAAANAHRSRCRSSAPNSRLMARLPKPASKTFIPLNGLNHPYILKQRDLRIPYCFLKTGNLPLSPCRISARLVL
jgi:enediyne biosynthesis protein E4